ncbi:hypothetical protein AM571_CH01410 [Rhizobium etli 8C-3]|uniref:Uncharacterized protein n=1 Tax=Rhizobium etli 8C-3 TaxID=538025 RepID=A0A1L5P284_RHIET|nr:hypothetical protein [Rhizobium etli]APO74245.1 hypothetical protein AM571_CH01410 [Rhizobium etli 8C-3]
MAKSNPTSITFRNMKMKPEHVAQLMRDLNRHSIPAASATGYECPKCGHVLAIAEIVERYCAKCGDIEPREVRA